MGLYWKAAAAALLAVVMILMLRRQEWGILLGMAACVLVILAAAAYLQPVTQLLDSLKTMGELDGELMTVLLKAAGIGLTTEIAGLICADSGNASLGKGLQLLGTVVILWLSIPLFRGLLELIRQILEGL